MWSTNKKNERLGMNFSTANNRLRKLIMMKLIQETGQDGCFRCGQKIEDVDDLSIEHKESWGLAEDPKAAFFDLENIAFSHFGCNSSANAQSRRTHCPLGHPYDEDNTYLTPNQNERRCRTCHNQQEKTKKRALVAAKGVPRR